MNGRTEERFWNTLQNLFVGVPVEGESGYINLMRLKTQYFQHAMRPALQQFIADQLREFPDFREELFDKLYTFLKRYISEKTGSIGFFFTPYHQSIYEHVYTDTRDVVLFWKTQRLYYVKTDRLFRSMETEVDGFKFYFDASALEHKKANEKRELVFAFKEIRQNDGALVFAMTYSEHGRQTDLIEIRRQIRDALGLARYTDAVPSEATLEQAFRVFERQSEVDYFLCKDAKSFLREQFDLWLWQYLLGKPNEEPRTEWTEARLKQLQALKRVAYRVIDYIAAFEDELVKIWNKPKFVLNSNYVITLDRIVGREGGWAMLDKILGHPNFGRQLQEWRELGMIDDSFMPAQLFDQNLKDERRLSPRYQYLPIDTRYFKDLELQLLALFDNLDESLDGWLIKSENYQALKTILPKWKGKVQCIFIDPPFNKADGDQFLYIADYLDSTWLTMLENRLVIARELLRASGSIFVNSDDKCNTYTRSLLDNLFVFQNEIIWCYEKPGAGTKRLKNNHSNIYFYTVSGEDYVFNTPYVPRMGETELTARQSNRFQVDYEGKISPDWWIDIPSFATMMTARERTGRMLGIDFPTQLPEKLLQRIIQMATHAGDVVLDFFAGSGVSCAVAHKMRRRWIAIEQGEHAFTIILPRMKKVLYGDESGISRRVSDYPYGGMFMYYELEQFSDTLRMMSYSPRSGSDQDIFQSPYEVLQSCLKMAHCISITQPDEAIVNTKEIYPEIDIAETISNITGRKKRRFSVSEDCKHLQLEDGSVYNLDSPDWKVLKAAFWW